MRDLILNNFWLKAFSLLLAILIWFAIQSNVQTTGKFSTDPFRASIETRDFRRPIVVMTSAGNRRVFSVEPSEVNVKVRADAATLKNLSPEDIQVSVKLIDVPEPHGSFAVEVNVPRDVNIQQIRPAHVYVKPIEPAISQ